MRIPSWTTKDHRVAVGQVEPLKVELVDHVQDEPGEVASG
jgi:hypothetical protein